LNKTVDREEAIIGLPEDKQITRDKEGFGITLLLQKKEVPFLSH
jgi:hypothetical protein